MLLRDYRLQETFTVRLENGASTQLAGGPSGKYSIVVLDVTLRVAGLDLAGDDSAAMPFTARELIDRVRASLRGTQSVAEGDKSEAVLAAGNLTMWPPQRRAEWRGIPLQLTGAEFGLLEILVRHAGRPVSKMELSERALGKPLTRHDRCIDVHLSRIRRKLGALTEGRSLIVAVRRRGYQFLKE